MIDFERIADAALSTASALLPRWLPTGQWEGDEWVALNPLRSDHQSGSFKVNRRTGRWADFATEDKGGDLISLYSLLNGRLSQVEAARRLANELGLISKDDSRSGRGRSLTASRGTSGRQGVRYRISQAARRGTIRTLRQIQLLRSRRIAERRASDCVGLSKGKSGSCGIRVPAESCHMDSRV